MSTETDAHEGSVPAEVWSLAMLPLYVGNISLTPPQLEAPEGCVWRWELAVPPTPVEVSLGPRLFVTWHGVAERRPQAAPLALGSPKHRNTEAIGVGPGDSHTWKKGGTYDHVTKWECSTCWVGFAHAYRIVPDFWLAAWLARVPLQCPGHCPPDKWPADKREPTAFFPAATKKERRRWFLDALTRAIDLYAQTGQRTPTLEPPSCSGLLVELLSVLYGRPVPPELGKVIEQSLLDGKEVER
jgi:hypothetical protein